MGSARPTVSTRRKGLAVIVAVYLVLGPVVGGVLFVPAHAATVFLVGDAAEARLFFLGGILLLPVFVLVGLPAGLACALAAAVETRLRGRPGWLMPILLATLGALVIYGRGGEEFRQLVPLLVSHWGAALLCTLVAQRVAQERWSAS